MKTISRYIMTLALLLTAVTGAWAKDVTENINLTTATVNGKNVTVSANQFSAYTGAGLNWNNGRLTVSTKDGSNIIQVVLNIKSGADKARDVTSSIGTCTVEGSKITATGINASSVTFSNTKSSLRIGSVEVTYVGPDPGTMVLSDAKTEATMEMPAYDVDVDYMLVRDMQDETNPVTFSGLPSSGNIVVKKGSDGKYQPAEALTIQLIDPLAAAETQNIIAADGITVKVLVGAENGQGAIDFDQDNPITLEAFLADMKPGYYWIKAEPTDENSPYDGTVYSSQFTVVEKYDLTVKPANDFSKGKVESVTVGSGSVTIDANTGKATKTGIDPETEVKLKAKRGYVIDKVEVKKGIAPPDPVTVTWNNLNFNSNPYTRDGVTLTTTNNSASGYNFYNYGDKTFTTTLGKFTRIEIVCEGNNFDGWAKEKVGEYQPDPESPYIEVFKLTWTGNAESVTIPGGNYLYGISSITFTIQ